MTALLAAVASLAIAPGFSGAGYPGAANPSVESTAATTGEFAEQSSRIKFHYDQFSGMHLTIDDIPIVIGSGFQYYEDGWRAGIYSSRWKPKNIAHMRDGSIEVRFRSDDGLAAGVHSFRQQGNTIKASYNFRWFGPNPVRIEHCVAQLWAPAFRDADIRIGGASAFDLERTPTPRWDLEVRKLGANSGRFHLDAPVVDLRIAASPANATIFDARQYNQEWARTNDIVWFGYLDQRIFPNQTLMYDVQFDLDSAGIIALGGANFEATTTPLSAALRTSRQNLPLIPKPVSENRTGGALTLGPSFSIEAPEQLSAVTQRFESRLWSRWAHYGYNPGPNPTRVAVRIDPSVGAESYRLNVSANGVEIAAGDSAGATYALETLTQLIEARNGQLAIPHAQITDRPSVRWRGVHLFTGPEALEMQTELMDRLLIPMRFNKAVVQSERSDWLASPGIMGDLSLPKVRLAALFDRYREAGIEPIPLIQSFGHMSWLFANPTLAEQHAYDPLYPFALDVRKEESRKLMLDIWREAIALLKPQTIHFGLDEVDNRGMPKNPENTTSLWVQWVPQLFAMAREHNLEAMLWSDVMLAPGEAIDATHAPNADHARRRRAAVPAGTRVADWHYAANPDPNAYRSLASWINWGYRPVASAWRNPRNVRGQALAASRNGAGYLQTTWAGYATNWPNLLREADQFAAYVLAGDYAWSARSEMPENLPYQPMEVLRSLLEPHPRVAKDSAGQALQITGLWRRPDGTTEMLDVRGGRAIRIGDVEFRLQNPVSLWSVVDRDARNAPRSLTINADVSAHELAFAIDCRARMQPGDEVAMIRIYPAGGGAPIDSTVIYAAHVRGMTDSNQTLLDSDLEGISCHRVRIGDDPVRIERIEVRTISPAAGLRIHGVTAY